MNKDNKGNKAYLKDADRTYQVEDYDREEQVSKGLSTSHEQVSDTYMEGFTDGKIDKVDEEGDLKTHNGEKISKTPYKS
ncbi:YozQ family protein [Thalassobacillus sp. CUG 92003]|uniref:YozQ family protein n=1 Tax=Thalassobacillus sp. CUG 92003 TaxID=2736641 RepID=UPI002104FABA|nr:YozQ family protein [Thalassobacillus sp. CUG 92003]